MEELTLHLAKALLESNGYVVVVEENRQQPVTVVTNGWSKVGHDQLMKKLRVVIDKARQERKPLEPTPEKKRKSKPDKSPRKIRPYTRLTRDDVLFIKAHPKWSVQRLAKKFGKHTNSIIAVREGDTYSDVK